MKFRAILPIFLLITSLVSAQQRVGVAYYNVDRLYDTVASPFYDDDDYTPAGRLQWNEERYRHKVESVAATIDSMSMPIVVLYGVENEQVVRDIASSCQNEYTYIHHTSSSLDGIDFALLYYADLLYPKSITTDFDSLIVTCTILDMHCTLVMNRSADDAIHIAKYLRKEQPQSHLLLFGRSSHRSLPKYSLRDAFAEERRKGRGTRCSSRGWYIPESVWVDERLSTESGIYVRSHLFDDKLARPKPTFSGSTYIGGASSHLPLYLYIWNIDK